MIRKGTKEVWSPFDGARMKGRVNGVRTPTQAYSEAGDVFRAGGGPMTSSRGRADDRRAGGAQMSPARRRADESCAGDALMTVLPEARR